MTNTKYQKIKGRSQTEKDTKIETNQNIIEIQKKQMNKNTTNIKRSEITENEIFKTTVENGKQNQEKQI